MDGWKRWLWLTLERAVDGWIDDGSTGARYAVLPMDEDGWEQDTVNSDKPKLQCPMCTQPLKPPIFQCAAGHFACGACHGQFPNKDRCYKCAHPGGCSRNFLLEQVTRSTPAKKHQAKCPDAPCRCSEPGCGFVGSPAWFIYHLRATHSWPVNVIDYGEACQLQLPASKPRCLLVAKEDMRVFVLTVAPAAHRGSVSLVCLRANAAAGPRYTCKMWSTAAATGKVEMEVPSSAVAGEETDGEAALVVMLDDGPSMEAELHLNVRIDRVQT